MPTFPTNATFTPRLQLPRPGLDDPADGPDAFNDLTDVLDPIGVVFLQGTAAARPAAGTAGRFHYATDTKVISYDNGTAWVNPSGAAPSPVASALPVLDVGMAGQIRAGRQLAVADFTALGLAQPIGLWNLSDLTNLGSDGRALANKGTVPFGVGINGLASTAAVFAGSTGQALYIVDSGAADPYRIRVGTVGCWFRTAKRATVQYMMAKWGTTVAASAWGLYVNASNVVGLTNSDGAGSGSTLGASDVCDDRWHFAVVTFDGTAIRVYVDGVLEGTTLSASTYNPNASAPLNIGSAQADSGTVSNAPHYGRVDEAFVTADVLSEDQVRAMYCAKLTHGLGVAPTRVALNVRRRKRGGTLAVADFPTQPLRLYNFTGGSLADEGSNGVALTAGASTLVGGADGTPNSAFSYTGGAGTDCRSTDAGLPAGTASRSYGCWFKTTTSSVNIMAWGGTSIGVADIRLRTGSSGQLSASNGGDDVVGPTVTDGQWHQAVIVEDNAAGDGVRRKLYLDGRLVAGSTVLNSVTLRSPGVATGFRVGAYSDGTLPFTGQIDGVFISAQALTFEQIAALYAKGSQALAPSPKNAGDHVEAMDATNILATFDTLDSTAQIDLGVAA